MKSQILDGCQIVLAVVITSAMVVANAQSPKEKPKTVVKPKAIVTQAKAIISPPATPAPVQQPVSEPSAASTASEPETPAVEAADTSGDDYYRNWIFEHESGNQLDRVNSIGCYGLGQDCNNVLSSACPDWRVNRECQVSFWNEYAQRRYGGWYNSYLAWNSQRDAVGNPWW